MSTENHTDTGASDTKIPSPKGLGLGASPCWEDLTEEQRNNRIGELIGAEPMRQSWIVWEYKFHNLEGIERTIKKTLGSLTLSLAESEAWLAHAKQSERIWKQKFDEKTCPTFKERDQVKIVEQVWHIRYSDTPGGGWLVVEAMIKAGFLINIEGDHAGWKITCDDWNPHHGRSTEKAATMAEAACKLALRRILPNR